MHFTSVLAGLALVKLSVAGYKLQDDYSVGNFFNMFDFFTASDPTHGFVNYLDKSSAQSSGLIKTSDSVYIGVDHSSVTSTGRNSVRLTSKNSYNSGLVILDLAHMPSSACGTWPAFWMVGADWPANGEIDIIEGVNSMVGNQMTLHTATGCTISSKNTGYSGSALTSNCDVNAAGQGANVGCGIYSNDGTSYGDGFNGAGGGVYAMKWTSTGIGVWHFSRGNIPSDITKGTPNPSGWGMPLARFSGGSCKYEKMFSKLQIVFDITFCGDWAGAVWGSDATCAPKAGSCNDFVANNPSAFQNSYWQINSLKVYQQSATARSAIEEVNNATMSEEPIESPVMSPAVSPSPSSMAFTTLQTSTKATTTSSAAVSTPAWSDEPLQADWFGSDSHGIPAKRDAIEDPAEVQQGSMRSNGLIKRYLKAHRRRFAQPHGNKLF